MTRNIPPPPCWCRAICGAGVRERVLSDGSIRTPMNEDDVRAACEVFKAEGVETVAISFVWSVLQPGA